MDFERSLLIECGKLIRRFERYAYELRQEDFRRERRSGKLSRGTIHRPAYWDTDRLFNPFLVRAASASISRAIGMGLKNGNYQPFNPVLYSVPKSDGSTRQTSVFNIADATISRQVYKTLLKKNISRMSSYSYAYRSDLTVHDAIQHIALDFADQKRIFLAEYDFTKYFDSISHGYLWQLISDKKFFVTDSEKSILESYLNTEPQEQASYQRVSSALKEPGVGIPQGTSISLFLANVAAWEIDRALERLGVGFARYADDTLIWSNDYGRICEAVNTLTVLGDKIGAKINLKKSGGVSIFAPNDAPVEMKTKSSVEFVGYSFTHQTTGMRKSVAARIKKRISYIIWANLLEQIEKGNHVPSRVTQTIDRDYLVMIKQIRRYLYGNLTEERISRFRDAGITRMNFPGVMSYFPALDNVTQLKDLDGWMLHTIYTSLAKRGKLLHAHGRLSLPSPHGIREADLPWAKAKSASGKVVDLRMPSFVRMGTLIKDAAAVHGPNAVGKSGGPQHYHYAD
ncbi:MAG TPA: reverse transcriptase domain-containing protein [Actinospica sp.]|jgi:hypothetical protein|nr:reverse transcriptase domain-containing protein [Actinospica sp.]